MAEQQDDQIARAEEATKKVLEHAGEDLPQKKQQEMGKPLKDTSGVNPQDMEFLHMLINKIENKEIELHTPSSLLNTPVYEKLGEDAQGKADYNAMNMLGTIRQIHQLWQGGDRDSFQIQNLVHQLRLTKERLEEIGGDIYII